MSSMGGLRVAAWSVAIAAFVFVAVDLVGVAGVMNRTTPSAWRCSLRLRFSHLQSSVC
jgi:hypothetical protein